MPPVLLVLDYPGRRAEPAVAELGLEGAGLEVRYLLSTPPRRQTTASAYADELLSAHGLAADPGLAAPRPVAVLAYCMAAAIGQDLARLVAQGAGRPVPLIVLDGEPATAETVREQYRVVAAQLMTDLGLAADVEEPEGAFAPELLEKDPDGSVELMRASLTVLAAAAIAAEIDDACAAAETGAQLADVYVDWLVHLVAAHNATWPSWDGEVLHLTSRDHPFTDAWYGPSWPGALRTTTERTRNDRAGLLRDPLVRERIAEFVHG
jgi:hypothetical protein